MLFLIVRGLPLLLEISDTKRKFQQDHKAQAWAQAQNITIKTLQREKDGEEETQDMTDSLNTSLPLKHRLFLLSIKDLNEYFYSNKCS